MAQINALSLNGARIIATANQARLANSVLRLFKSPFLPSITSTKDDFLAQECDFDGYAPATIVAWGAPILLGTAWATFAPTQTFRWTLDTEATGNMVGGWFLLTAAGELMDYAVFDPAVPVQGPGQAVVTTPIEITPAGAPQ